MEALFIIEFIYLPNKNDHRMPRGEEVTVEEIFTLKHRIDFVENGYFSKLIGKDNCLVNSLHGQAIDTLSKELKIEAQSDDNVIEAVSIPKHPFIRGRCPVAC